MTPSLIPVRSPPGTNLRPRRKLPIGIQTFAKLREQNFYHLDKTALAMHPSDSGT